MDRLTEREIKAVCLSTLQRLGRIDADTTIASEFPVKGAASRIDLALLTKTIFVGVEIKSERDSLRRLRNQIETFSASFDLLIVVLAGKHASVEVELPPNVELWELHSHKLVRHKAIRKVRQGESLSKLLTKRRLRSLQRMHSVLPTKIVRKALFEEFQARYRATSKAFWAKAEKIGMIREEDLALLSPHNQLRLDRLKTLHQERELLKRWSKYYSDHSSSVS